MKLAIISDIQRGIIDDLIKIDKFKKIIKEDNFDGIIVAGDITFPYEIFSSLNELNIQIFYVFGNDNLPEDIEKLSSLKNVINIDGKKINFNAINIIGSGGAVKSGKEPHGFYLYDEKERFNELDKLFEEVTNPTILVTHCPPKGFLDYATFHSKAHIGSKAIKKIIRKYQPTICFCGHVHKDGGKIISLGKTRIVNVAGLTEDTTFSYKGRRFCILEINKNGQINDLRFDYLIDNINIPLKEIIKNHI